MCNNRANVWSLISNLNGEKKKTKKTKDQQRQRKGTTVEIQKKADTLINTSRQLIKAASTIKMIE